MKIIIMTTVCILFCTMGIVTLIPYGKIGIVGIGSIIIFSSWLNFYLIQNENEQKKEREIQDEEKRLKEQAIAKIAREIREKDKSLYLQMGVEMRNRMP